MRFVYQCIIQVVLSVLGHCLKKGFRNYYTVQLLEGQPDFKIQSYLLFDEFLSEISIFFVIFDSFLW